MQETQTFKKFTAIYHEHFELEVEYNEEYCVLHFARFDKLTPSVYKLGLDYINRLVDFLKVMEFPGILIVVKEEDDPLNKFVQKFGFTLVSNHEYHNIYRREI